MKRWRLAAAWSATLAALPGAAAVEEDPPLPPPPFAPDQGLAQADERLRALNGEWRLGRTDGRPATNGYTLTIWGSAFAAGRGCAIAQGQLRALGDGRYRVERYGPIPAGCRRLTPPEPFELSELHLGGDRTGLFIRSAEGRQWLFAWEEPARTRASDDFLRDEWLLADAKGRPYRAGLTRVSFERGYSVRAANCQFQTNGWSTERNFVVRPGGSQYLETANCRPKTLGDRLARAGEKAQLIAEPVEGRLRVIVGGRSAMLVPAARFPELSGEAKAYPVNIWARQLADVAARLPRPALDEFLIRVLGNGDARVGAGDNAPVIAFSGYSIAEMDRMRLAGLPVDGLTRPAAERSFEEVLLGAPIVAVAELEAIEPADRGDGLSLDYRYRVVESWRGRRRTGDLLIVRMPPMIDKSRSTLITPEPGGRVLLLASRPGYLMSILRNGKPPSMDQRVVSMTLPLMRIRDGKLAEAVSGANVLGAAKFAGMTVEQARTRARELEAKVAAATAEARGQRRFHYFVTQVGSRALPDPTRLWIEYDPDLRASGKPGLGAVTAWFDGCLTRIRGIAGHAPPIRACSDSGRTSEPAISRAVAWIDAHGVPEEISLGEVSEPLAAIRIPSNPPLALRGGLR
jgi:hypothetical protein